MMIFLQTVVSVGYLNIFVDNMTFSSEGLFSLNSNIRL